MAAAMAEREGSMVDSGGSAVVVAAETSTAPRREEATKVKNRIAKAYRGRRATNP